MQNPTEPLPAIDNSAFVWTQHTLMYLFLQVWTRPKEYPPPVRNMCFPCRDIPWATVILSGALKVGVASLDAESRSFLSGFPFAQRRTFIPVQFARTEAEPGGRAACQAQQRGLRGPGEEGKRLARGTARPPELWFWGGDWLTYSIKTSLPGFLDFALFGKTS